ncbi:MAG: hypothetical protein JXR73_06750 [Candidatus Omnitrophica bacterium]|nr:hypothetical protein [Candidatus Omnitrophota bacterium]
MKNPTQCVLWENPELVRGPSQDFFELMETYVDDSHLSRRLLKCRECGQLYFFEFYEEIDWVDGDDPQYSTYIPVETGEEVQALKNSSQFGLLQFFPRLQIDFPKEAKKPKIWWNGKE